MTMTMFPLYLSEYPNMNSSFPFHISIHRIDRQFASHRHDYLEFSYVIEGQGSEIINGVKHVMKPGTFTFVLPYQIHEIHAEPDAPLRLYNCMFGMNILFDTHADMGLRQLLWQPGEPFPSYVHFEHEHHVQMTALLQDMQAEYEQSHVWKQALLRAKLIEVLVRFDRLRRAQFEMVYGEGEAGHHPLLHQPSVHDAQNKIWQVVNYVHHHYQENITLNELSQLFHISPSHLSESFKRYVGKNFVQFLHELRIRHACGLLSSTEMSIADIAMEVGYGSYNTFARVFREKKRLTPQSYRSLNNHAEKERGSL